MEQIWPSLFFLKMKKLARETENFVNFFNFFNFFQICWQNCLHGWLIRLFGSY